MIIGENKRNAVTIVSNRRSSRTPSLIDQAKEIREEQDEQEPEELAEKDKTKAFDTLARKLSDANDQVLAAIKVFMEEYTK